MAQWIHCYETNDKVLGSIIHALSDSFADYQLYMMSGNDILIVASADGPVADPDPAFFRNPAYRDLLTRVNIHNFSDIQSRHLGGKKFFAPYLAMLDSPANSDYFPFVDQHAAESRFKNEFSQGFYNKTSLLNLLVAFRADAHLVTATDYNMMAKDFVTARLLYQRLVDRKLNLVFGDDESILKIFEQRLQDCQLSAEWESSALWVAAQTSPFLSADDANAIWRQIEQSACFKKAPDDAKNLVALLDSFTAGHDEALLMQLQNLSRQYRRPALQLYKHPFFQELIFITMIRSGHADYVRDVWTTLTPAMQQREDLRFLLMTANYKAVSI